MILFKFGSERTIEFMKQFKGYTVAEVLKIINKQSPCSSKLKKTLKGGA